MTLFSSVDLRNDHVFLTRDLLAAGHSDKSITRAVRAGSLIRLRHGAYAPAASWAEWDPRERRMLLANATLRLAGADCVLARDSAADVLGAPVWEPSGVTHLARLNGKADRRTAIKTQHRGILLAEDVTVRHGVPITSGTRTALDMTTSVDVEHALVTVNGLLRAGETTTELMLRGSESRIHHPHSLRTRIVMGLADGRCESAGESRSLHLCWRQHLPKPELQFAIRDATGRVVARVDFAWPELGVFMEFDGKVKYGELLRVGETPADVVMREKRREQLILGLTGWRCIRISWVDLLYPERTAARIRATLAGRPWAA